MENLSIKDQLDKAFYKINTKKTKCKYMEKPSKILNFMTILNQSLMR